MGLKTASDVTRLGKKFSEIRKAGQANNPKLQHGRTADNRKTGIVRASDRE